MKLVRDIFAFFDLFLFIILARNIECLSILQKTFKQFRLVASKYKRRSRYKNNSQCVSLLRRVCLCPVMSRDMFLQSAFQFGFLTAEPCLFPLKSSLEFVVHRGKPKFISFPVKFPGERSKFQFYTTVRSKLIIIFPRIVLPCLYFFFLKTVAEIMIHMLFNTLLKITPHNRQKRRKRKERTKKGTSRQCSRWVTYPVPNPARQGLT